MLEWPVLMRRNGRSGSVRVNHAPALNGGTTVRSSPSRVDGGYALLSATKPGEVTARSGPRDVSAQPHARKFPRRSMHVCCL